MRFLIDDLSDSTMPPIKAEGHTDIDQGALNASLNLFRMHKEEPIEGLPSIKRRIEQPIVHRPFPSPRELLSSHHYDSYSSVSPYAGASPNMYSRAGDSPNSYYDQKYKLGPTHGGTSYQQDEDEIVYVPVRRSSLSKGVHLKAPHSSPRVTDELRISPPPLHEIARSLEESGSPSHISFGHAVASPKKVDGRIHKKRDNRSARMLPPKATEVLKQWYDDHANHPYPTFDEKQQLMAETGLSLHQVNTWYVNRRCRDKKEK
jgi:hypothetical protein